MERAFGKRVGGRLCLDFVNTVRARVRGGPAGGARDFVDRVVDDRLESYQALLSWARFADVLEADAGETFAREAAGRPEDAAAVLERAVRVREAMYRIFRAGMEGWTPEAGDLDVLNRELRIARDRERLVAAPEIGWEWDGDPAALDRVLWPVVRSAAELLTGPERKRVRQCPGSDCGWLFLDTSRAGRRRWCDMADCGNVAKVRRFRRRQGSSRSPVEPPTRR